MGNHLKKQALCIASVASNLDNFNRNNVKILQELGYEVTLAANFYSKEDINSQEKINDFAKEMRAIGVHITHIDFARSPKKAVMQIKSILQIRKLLARNFDLIHCHTPVCAVIVRALAQKYRRKYGTRVFYTAHGFHFYTGAPLKNWLVFYPVEKWMSRYTDVLITINKEDYKRAKTKFHAKKTVYVPGIGVDTKKFGTHRRSDEIRKELGIGADEKILLSVGELNENKNHEIVIRALAKCKNIYHYIIVGQGRKREQLESLIRELGLEEKVKLVGFREDVADFYDAADAFVFPSFREGLSVSLMEAMASGLPVVCSRIRGNTDLIDDGKGGYLFNPSEIDDVEKSIGKLMEEDRIKFGTYNLQKISKFDLKNVGKRMTEAYGGIGSHRP